MKKTPLKSIALGSLLLSISNIVSADELIHEFNFFDQNRDTQITYDEFFIIMIHQGTHQIHNEFLSADKDENQTLSFDEAKIFDVSYDEYEKADKDKSNSVDLQEFVAAYIQYSFEEFDKNESESIDLSEFIQAQEVNS